MAGVVNSDGRIVDLSVNLVSLVCAVSKSDSPSIEFKFILYGLGPFPRCDYDAILRSSFICVDAELASRPRLVLCAHMNNDRSIRDNACRAARSGSHLGKAESRRIREVTWSTLGSGPPSAG